MLLKGQYVNSATGGPQLDKTTDNKSKIKCVETIDCKELGIAMR